MKRTEEEHKQLVISLGFEYGAESIPESVEKDPRVVKVNLPPYREESSWKNGNGEGIWAYIRSEDDLEKYNQGKGTFDVVLMNTSFYYSGLLLWGAVIRVDGRGPSSRPVLNKEWLDEKIKLAEKQETGR